MEWESQTMRLRIPVTVMATFALATVPVIAHSADQPSDRAAAAFDEAEELVGVGGGGLVVALLGAAAVVAGIVVLIDGDDTPSSP